MRFQHPNFIDVVETRMLGTQVLTNTIGEFSNQMRFWPALKFERSVLNAVSMGYSQIYFFYFSLLLAATVYMLFAMSYKRQRSIVMYVVTFVFVYISPVTVDTYWRLGAAETLFTFFLVFSVWALKVGRYGWMTVFLIGLMTTKESAVFYVPVYLCVLLWRRRHDILGVVGILYGAFLVKIILLVQYALTHSTYTSMLTNSVSGVVYMILHIVTFYSFYVMIAWGACVLFAYRIISQLKGGRLGKIEFSYVFFALTLSGICTLVAFRNVFQPYYAFPFIITGITWLLYELNYVTVPIVRGVIIFLFGLFLIIGIPQQTLQRMIYWQKDYAGDNVLIEEIRRHPSIQYRLAREYRPEYAPGLKYIQDVYNTNKSVGIIFLISNEEVYSDSIMLCVSTLFQKHYCKWGVKYNE